MFSSSKNQATDDIHWIFDLKLRIPEFLTKLQGGKTPGFFHYSLTGDLFSEEEKWGLGNTVFAVKCYYTLGILDALAEEEKKNMANFIKCFQVSNGEIFDPLIKQKARRREIFSAMKHLDPGRLSHKPVIRAETRQAISSLKLLGEEPDNYPKKYPATSPEINKYLSRLDWTKPWGAGSHFSHLLFFLANSKLNNKDELINFAIDWINKIQDPSSGSWFQGKPSTQQKINGAMKIITGFKAADRMNFKYPEQLVDLAMSATNDRHACDNFNIVYVLKYASEQLHGQYRKEEIDRFALNRLNIYKEYYWPKFGGFSFLKGMSNDFYYNALITKGLPEPDIHGTVMFLWGIAQIAQILNINGELGFNEFAA